MTISVHRKFRGFWLSILLLLSATVHAVSPTWWDDHSILVDAQPEDYALANIGQLKFMATEAKKHLTVIHNISYLEWAGVYPNGGNPDTFLNTGNFSLLNQGQLKLVADGFYSMLELKGGDPQGLLNVNAPWTYNRPWTTDTNTDDSDFSRLI